MKNIFQCCFVLLAANVGLATEFSAKVVDGFGRPVPDATISVYWLKKSTDGEVKSVELLNCKSSANGTARGRYDRKSVPADETKIPTASAVSHSLTAKRSPRPDSESFETRELVGFVPLPYQPENNEIPVKTPPTGFDTLRTIAVSRIYERP